ncbi:MAG TPA: hypothetical protein VLR49_12960, partial [Ferruginibacter sp.]|nr:hypothetical protein [Ferruginibacter sp.]
IITKPEQMFRLLYCIVGVSVVYFFFLTAGTFLLAYFNLKLRIKAAIAVSSCIVTKLVASA